MAIKIATAAVSQSVVGRGPTRPSRGIIGMLQNPYVLTLCLFASLGYTMCGYNQGVMGSILVIENFEPHFPLLSGSTIQGWPLACSLWLFYSTRLRLPLPIFVVFGSYSSSFLLPFVQPSHSGLTMSRPSSKAQTADRRASPTMALVPKETSSESRPWPCLLG